MMREKRVTQITAALKKMSKKDISSLLLFTLYKMRGLTDCLTLSEIPYMLSDQESLVKLLTYFGGMTITFPQMKDFRLAISAMMLYQFVNLEHGSFEEGIKSIVADKEFTADEVKEFYNMIVEVMKNYDFGRAQ